MVEAVNYGFSLKDSSFHVNKTNIVKELIICKTASNEPTDSLRMNTSHYEIIKEIN